MIKEFPIIPDDYDVGFTATDDTARVVAEDIAPVVIASVAGSREVNLVFPFKVERRWLRKVSIRLPSQGDIDDFSSGDLPTLRDLLSRLTGLHPAVLKALIWHDSAAVHQVFRDVLPAFIAERLDD